MIDPGLAGKVTLVTGANNPLGIGAAIAEAFARQGAAVFMTALPESPGRYGIDPAEAAMASEPSEAFSRARNADPLDGIVQRLRPYSVPIGAVKADLSDPAAITPLFDRIESELGLLDILVSNAAHATPDSSLPSSNEH